MPNETIAQMPDATTPLDGDELIEISKPDGLGGFVSQKIKSSNLVAATVRFDSAPLTIDDTTNSYKVAHSLGYVPAEMWVDLICISPDAGLQTNVGDVIDFSNSFNSNNLITSFTTYRDAIFIELALQTPLIGNEGQYLFNPRGGSAGGTFNPTSFANFKLVLHAR